MEYFLFYLLFIFCFNLFDDRKDDFLVIENPRLKNFAIFFAFIFPIMFFEFLIYNGIYI